MKKGSKQAKAWGRRMKALRMGISRRITRRKKVKVRRRTGVFRMARKHKRVSHRRGLMGGTSSLLKSALIGVGTAHFAGYVPVNVPMKEEMAGALGAYMVGGKNVKSAVVGAGAVYLAKMLNGTSGVGSSQNSYGF